MCPCLRHLAVVKIEFTKQPMSAQQSYWLTWLGCRLQPLRGACVCRTPVVTRAKILGPAAVRVSSADDTPAPFDPAIECVEPAVRGVKVARIECELYGERAQRHDVSRRSARIRFRTVRQSLINERPGQFRIALFAGKRSDERDNHEPDVSWAVLLHGGQQVSPMTVQYVGDDMRDASRAGVEDVVKRDERLLELDFEMLALEWLICLERENSQCEFVT